MRKGVQTLVFLSLLASGLARAENSGLAALQPVPMGERVANYLQTYMMKLGTIVEAKSSGGIFDGVKTYRVVVSYDPEGQDMDVAVIGMAQDLKTTQNMLGTVRDIILKLNPKLQKYFGVTLQGTDLSMDYLYAKSGAVLMTYRDGKYLDHSKGKSDTGSQ